MRDEAGGARREQDSTEERQKYRAGIGAIEVGDRIDEVLWHWHTGQVVIAIEGQPPVVNTAGRVRTESNVSISTLASGILRDLVLWHRGYCEVRQWCQ